MRRRFVFIVLALFAAGLFAEEGQFSLFDTFGRFWVTPSVAVNTYDARLTIAEICPVSDSVCKIRYDNGAAEYVRKGDVFKHALESDKSDPERRQVLAKLYTVKSFDYNVIVCDIADGTLESPYWYRFLIPGER